MEKTASIEKDLLASLQISEDEDDDEDDETETREDDEDSDDLDDEDSEDDEEESAPADADLEVTKVPLVGYSASDISGQILAQATCVSLNTAGAWTYAVRRECGSGPDCTATCAALTESQGGRLSAFNSLHLYGDLESNTDNKLGLKTYKYNGVGGGCGPNYCCCRATGATMTKDLAEVEVEEDTAELDDMEIAPFDRYDLDGQIQAEAVCTALAPSDKSGWTYAVRRDCTATNGQTCDQLCAASMESQVQSAGAKQLWCLNAIHIYDNQATDKSHVVGLKTYRYNSCAGTSCGPNYCCCWGGYNNVKP